MAPRIRQWEIPLVAAESRLRITTNPRGRKAVLTFEFAPAAFTGDTPGIEFQATVGWKEAVTFGKALASEIAPRYDDGVDTVQGQNYGRLRVAFNENAARNQGGNCVFVFLTGEDCRTIAHTIAEAAAYATMNVALDIAGSR